jgi:HAD superfamily hydrolase (TIGR01549 family)
LGTQVYRRIISELTHDLTEDEDLQRTVLDDYLNHVSKKYMEMQTPYPEARDVLTKLIQEYSMGLIANQPKEARSCLESLGFAKYLKVIVLSEEVGFTKPDPQIFRYALSKADCKPQKAMMVGDRLDNDVAPAKAIGMRTVRVKRGLMRFQKPLAEMESPDCEITTLRGLLTHCFRR